MARSSTQDEGKGKEKSKSTDSSKARRYKKPSAPSIYGSLIPSDDEIGASPMLFDMNDTPGPRRQVEERAEMAKLDDKDPIKIEYLKHVRKLEAERRQRERDDPQRLERLRERKHAEREARLAAPGAREKEAARLVAVNEKRREKKRLARLPMDQREKLSKKQKREGSGSGGEGSSKLGVRGPDLVKKRKDPEKKG